ncbi:MAG: sigma-70 family RNA polymerase sigma factor [Anaerolineales bacterium]
MTSISIPQMASQTMKVDISAEKELLQAALRLDQKALAQIYDLYSPELYRYAARFLGDPCVAEDCVADTFSRFLKVIRDQRGPKNYLRAYLYRIAHNWVADYYRRAPDVVELKDTVPGSESSPEQEAALRIRQAQTRKAILQLTPDQQQVIALKYLQSMTNEEVSLALNRPVGAVKSLQHRALARLEKILSKEKSI